MASQHHTVDSASVMEVDFGSRQGQPPEERMPEFGANAAEEVRSAAPGAAVYPPETPEPPRRKRWIGLLLGLLALGAFVAVVWFAYDSGLSSGYREEVPTIRADTAPIKVKPENPGGLDVPNQDKLVLNQSGEPGAEPVERLLSEPETPEPLVAPEPSGPMVTLSPDDPTLGFAMPPGEGVGAVLDPAPGAASEAGAPLEPDVAADTVEKTLAALAERARQQEEFEAAQRAAAQGTAAGAGGNAASSAASSAGSSGSAASAGGQAGGSAAGAGNGGGAASPTTTQLVAIEKGDYVIQLASVTSADAASSEWGRIRKAYPELLGDMTLSVQEATVNGTRYHRVQTGPFPSRATAQDLCAQLQSQKQPCIVQRR